MSASVEYRDRIYMRKDILLKLTQYSHLNQTALLSYCGLNLKKHKSMLDDMENKRLITKREVYRGKKKVTEYMITGKGIDFCRKILEHYEMLFPRRKSTRYN